MREKAKIAVVGSGVIGMTTALCLARNAYKTTVVAKDRHAQTTSASAAALWYPFKAEPKEKVAAWAQRSLAVFREMESIPEAGVVWPEFSELLLPEADLPWWRTTVEGFRYDDQIVSLPAGRRRVCHYYVPIMDTNTYLDYLYQSLKALDVAFVEADLSSIDQAFDFGETVVNCSGIGAIKLVNDHDLHPGRGQVVRIKRQPSHLPVLDLTQDPKFAHVTPRLHDTIVGGTYEEGVFSLEPDPNETMAIIERCKAIFPALGEVSKSDILGTVCGLRPVRSAVRVEPERFGKSWIFHNYGHGGAGFTLSWGCAEEIVSLVEATEI